MALNYIFIFFFLASFLIAIVKMVFLQDYTVLPAMKDVIFERAKTGFDLSIGLTGALAFFMGIMKVGERAGAIEVLARLMSPFFKVIFPEVPKNHPAFGSIMMNFSANMLGLDNAATPMGLQAMEQLQEINPDKDRATNAQIMFLVLNTSGLTIIPVSILALRAASGASNPTDIFIPILIATFFSSLGGLIITSIVQRINLFNKYVVLYIGAALLFIMGLIYVMTILPPAQGEMFSNILASLILLGFITSFVAMGAYKKINVYDSFIDGAKDGFNVAVRIIPYLVAILVAVGLFTTSGGMKYATDGLRYIFGDAKFIDAIPTALMKPLSGGGARGMMVETWQQHGPDSFAGRLAAIFQGSSETTFYVLAVYFGSVAIRNTRYAVWCGLAADIVGVIASIIVAYFFFGNS